jgi:hypothetical protein
MNEQGGLFVRLRGAMTATAEPRMSFVSEEEHLASSSIGLDLAQLKRDTLSTSISSVEALFNSCA